MLEKSLAQKTSELNEEKSKFEQIKQDFKYNLKLLEERDSELEKFEQTMASIRKNLYKNLPIFILFNFQMYVNSCLKKTRR